MTRLKYVVLFIFLCLTNVRGQETDSELFPRVDKRIELINIMYRLATGKSMGASNPVYTAAIDLHFKKYSNHRSIQCLKSAIDSLHKKGVDARAWELPSLAVHLSQPPELEPLVGYKKSPADGWDDRTLFNSNLILCIQEFYRDSECHAFFESQQAYYQSVSEHYRKEGVVIDKVWLKQFFGLEMTETYFPIVPMSTSEGAYLRVNFGNTRRHTITLFSVSAFNSQGLPTNFSDPVFRRLLLHEHVHAYANQLVDKNKEDLKSAAERLLARPEVWAKFKDTFFNNWEFLLYESMVRACCLKYAMLHPEYTTDAEKEIRSQEDAGFLWIRGLVDELSRYENNRAKYSDLSEFMPEVILFFNKQANQ